TADGVDRNADFIQEALEGELTCNDADGAGQGAGFGEDFGATHRDVVAAAGGDIAHAGDDGLFSFDAGDFAPHQIARESRSARTIDAQHDADDLGIFFGVTERFDDGVAAHALAAKAGFAFAATDFADGVDDGDFLAGARGLFALVGA